MQVKQRYGYWVLCGMVGALVACGGGGSGTSASSSSSISGLAATGAGIANATVTAKCAGGAPLTGTTDSVGSYNLVLDGRTLPCMVQVTGGTPSVTLHSFAQAAGRVNVTPVTDLIVAKALGSDPATAFTAYIAANGTSIEMGLTAAKSYVSTQVNSITGSTIADPMTGTFAIGDADDKVLDALGNAMTAASKTIADLRTQAQSGATLTSTVPAHLAAPTGLTASASSSSSIGLSWTAVPGATGYKIYRATSASVATSGTATATSTATTYSDTGLTASTAYYYKVVPNNSVVSAGAASSEATATTSASGGGGGTPSTWTPHALPIGSGSFADVVWDGSKFVAIGNYVGTSTDGATWTTNALLEGKGIAISGSTLLLSGISTSSGSDIRKSVDGGVSWTRPATANIFTVAGNASMFVGIGGGWEAGNGQPMTVRTSADGETWTTRYTEAVPNAQSKVTSLKPIWSGSKWMISAFNYDPTQIGQARYEFFVLTSTDGVNWTKTVVANVKGSNYWPWWPVWTGSEFVLIDRTKTLKSTDGVTWPATATTSNFTNFGENSYDFVSHTGTEFVAFSGGGSSVKIWKSADAVSWTSSTTTATQPIYGGVSNGSTYVAVGNQFVFTSP
jgi:hypothetical protein